MTDKFKKAKATRRAKAILKYFAGRKYVDRTYEVYTYEYSKERGIKCYRQEFYSDLSVHKGDWLGRQPEATTKDKERMVKKFIHSAEEGDVKLEISVVSEDHKENGRWSVIVFVGG